MPQVKRLKAATHRFLKENRNMKIKNVFDEIFSIDNLYAALEDASQGRRYNKDALIYNLDVWAMVQEIRNEIFNGTYSIDRYYIFYVYEPKKRMIMSISFKHRIVQWAIYRVINPVLVKGYIEDSYGCIPGRGSLSAMQRLKYWVVMASRKEEQWFYLKLDISKYFYRISHRVLKKILAKKIKDKRLLKVLYSIIDCEHTPFGLPLGRSPGDVPLEERLFDVGMPIGNLLLQLFANVYLNELDQYCKRELQIRFYIRYMDDVIILSPDKELLHRYRNMFSDFLGDVLKLRLNNKTAIRPVSHGMEFVGYTIRPFDVRLRKSTSLRMKRHLKTIQELYRDYEIDLDRARSTLMSYKALMDHCDCRALEKKIFEDFVLTHNPKEADTENG